MLKKIATSLALLPTVPAIAETASEKNDTLDTVYVTALRGSDTRLSTPASLSVITADDLRGTSKTNLSDALKGVPGLQANERENYAQDLQISMRGFGARSTFGIRGTRLYADGIPATQPDGQGQTSNIDLTALDKIEVLGGPFSSLYGNSSGGTLLAFTKEGLGRPSAAVGFNAGKYGKQQSSLQLQGGSNSAAAPAYFISSSYLDTDGHREHSGARKVLNNGKLTWLLDDGSKIDWVLNQVRIRADDAGGLTRSQWLQNPRQVAQNVRDYNMRKEIDQIQTGVTLSKPVNDNNTLTVMLYTGRRHVVQYQSIPAAVQLKSPGHPGGVIDFTRHYYGSDIRWENKNSLPGLTLAGGLAFDRVDEDRRGYTNFIGDIKGVKGNLRRDEDNAQWNLDPYAQASWKFHPDWRLTGGLRYSNVHFSTQDRYLGNGDDSGRRRYSTLLPSLSLDWNFQPGAAAYLSYGKGFETPTFTETAYRPDGGSGFNDALKPSKSDTVEAGLKFDKPWGLLSSAIFHTRTRDDIVSAGSYGGRSTFRNADRTLRYGGELAWEHKIWRDLNLRSSYSYVHAVFDADIAASGSVAAVSKGSRIPGVAANRFYAGAQWQPETGWQGGIDIRYMDKIYVNNTNSEHAPGYTLVSANVGYEWQHRDWHLSTYARVDNLFNRQYAGSVIVNESNGRYFEPSPGRNFSAGINLRHVF